MKLEPCDIILTKGNSEISEEIEEATKSSYSHSAIMIKENSLLIEAGYFKVRYNALEYYEHYDVYRYVGLDNFQKAQIVNYLVNQIGKKYDYKLLIYEYIRYRLGIILPFWFPNSSSVICSELISDSYRSIGIDLCPGIKYPSPADLSESKLLTKIQ